MVDIVISDAATGHTLIDIMLVNPTRRDLVERAAHKDMVAPRNAQQRQEAHYRDHMSGTIFVAFSLETCGALFAGSDRSLVEFASLASEGVWYRVPLLAWCARGFAGECLLQHSGSLAHYFLGSIHAIQVLNS